MNEAKRKRLEAAGWVVGDFDQFATEVLGMDEAEARYVAHRADMGSAIRRARQAAGMTQAAYGKLVGVAQAKLARIEVGAPEISTDMITRVYLAAGGSITITDVAPPVGGGVNQKPIPRKPSAKAVHGPKNPAGPSRPPELAPEKKGPLKKGVARTGRAKAKV